MELELTKKKVWELDNPEVNECMKKWFMQAWNEIILAETEEFLTKWENDGLKASRGW